MREVRAAKELTPEDRLLLAVIRRVTLVDDALKKGEHSKALDEARELMKDSRAVFEALYTTEDVGR